MHRHKAGQETWLTPERLPSFPGFDPQQHHCNLYQSAISVIMLCNKPSRTHRLRAITIYPHSQGFTAMRLGFFSSWTQVMGHVLLLAEIRRFQRPSQTMEGCSQLLLASHPLKFHWPKEITWPSSISMRQGRIFYPQHEGKEWTFSEQQFKLSNNLILLSQILIISC